MITSLSEFKKVNESVDKAKQELDRVGSWVRK